MICLTALLLCSLAALEAQTPPIPTRDSFSSADQADKNNSVKGQGPVAPATLLLLGLAGGFAGVKIYRNNKKEEL